MAPRTPRIEHADARQRLIELGRDYSEDTLGSPSRFFPVPELPQIELTPAGDGPLGTHIVDMKFASDYLPFHRLIWR